jgi:hypothetical protein
MSYWWPTTKNLNDVLLISSTEHSPAVALAVHQPMAILRRSHHEPIGTPNATLVDEHQILARIVEDAPGDGSQLTLIEGRSGTGKSHVVYWLQLKLDQQTDRDSRVILWVGKGSRLSGIVAKLCEREELAGERYAALRNRLQRGQDPITPEDAAGRLCQQLAFVCDELYKSATTKAQSGQALTQAETLHRKWGHPSALPSILVHLPLRPALIGVTGPMRRLVDNLHSSASVGSGRERQEFHETDLRFQDLPDELHGDAQLTLNRLERSEESRHEAATVLNEALDSAKMVIAGLNPGVVSDVFKAVRTVLLEQGKELVLLIEDFSDLSGIQGEILQAAIQTCSDESKGVPKYCTLRTVIAYTDNRITEGTVLSRAQHVYYVPSEFDGRSTVDKAMALVAAYLRAARLGKERLTHALAESTGKHDEWLAALPVLEAQEEECPSGFGYPNGISLFPFTIRSIERLLADFYGLADDTEAMPFIPRDIVTSVMRRVLNDRDAFMRGEFPSAGFVPNPRAALSADETKWLRQIGNDRRDRVRRFLPYWGLDKDAARAFKLPEPDDDGVKPGPVPGPLVTPSPSPPPVADIWAPHRKTFEDWRRGTDIQGGMKNTIRRAIAHSIYPAVAWTWRSRKPPSGADTAAGGRWGSWHEAINIAGMAPSQGVDGFELVSETERADAALSEGTVRELTSVVACAIPEFTSWNIAGVEHYLVAHMSFVERHRDSVQARFQSTSHARSFSALPWLVNATRLMGLALGIRWPIQSEPDEQLVALFASSEPVPASNTASLWHDKVLTTFAALRPTFQDFIRYEIGAYQGSGAAVHAIDASKLLQVFSDSGAGHPFDYSLPDFSAGARSEFLTAIVSARTAFRLAEKESESQLKTRRERASKVEEDLGPIAGRTEEDIATHTKARLITAIESLRAAAADAQIVAEANIARLGSAIATFRGLAIVRALESAKKLPQEGVPFDERLAALGENDPDAEALSDVQDVIAIVDEFMKRVQRGLPEADKVDPLDEALSAHNQELSRTRSILGQSTGEVVQ